MMERISLFPRRARRREQLADAAFEGEGEPEYFENLLRYLRVRNAAARPVQLKNAPEADNEKDMDARKARR